MNTKRLGKVFDQNDVSKGLHGEKYFRHNIYGDIFNPDFNPLVSVVITEA